MPALAPGFTGAPDGRGAIVIFSASDSVGTLRVDRYTPGDPGKWKRLASIAAGIRDAHAVNDKGTIYLVGLTIDGRHGRTVAYHPKTGSFNLVEGMPTPREHPAVTVGAKDGAIYVLGGRASPCCDHVTSNGALTTVERFDPHTGHWTRRSPMPWPDTHPSAASVGSTVYLFLPARVWMYDPAGDRWKPGPANLSYGTMGAATAGPDGLIRVFSCTRYDVFDVNQGHWQPGLALLTPRCDPLVALDGGSQMYVFGGEYSGDPGRVVESANAGGG